MEWQPIETAPKDGTPVLGYADGGIATVTWIQSTTYGAWAGSWGLLLPGTDSENLMWWPTHWMPLPAPPAEP